MTHDIAETLAVEGAAIVIALWLIFVFGLPKS